MVLHGNILQQRGFTTGANKVLHHGDTSFSRNLAQLRTLPPAALPFTPILSQGRRTQKSDLLSCHCAVLLICYMRDNFSDDECRLELTGSDVLEDFWSKNGQRVGNNHKYNFENLSRNTSHVIRLEQIRVNPNAPEVAKPQPKQESIWAHPEGYEKACLNHYPAHREEERKAWREGISLAQGLARSVGMAPTDALYIGVPGDGGDDNGSGCGVNDVVDDGCGNSDCTFSETNIWSYRPFRYPGNKFCEGNGSLPTENTDEYEACNGGPCMSGI